MQASAASTPGTATVASVNTVSPKSLAAPEAPAHRSRADEVYAQLKRDVGEFRLVPGDLYVLAASIGWAVYSWMLMHPTPESAPLRANWQAF